MSSASQLMADTRKTFPLKLSLGIAFSFGIYLAVLSLSSEETNNGLSFFIATFGGLTAILSFYYILRKIKQVKTSVIRKIFVPFENKSTCAEL